MRRNPYEILGVKRDATQKDIQSAFRKLAKKHHPDLNPGNKASEDLFKDITAAHEIIGDEERRKRFDRGEIDVNGEEQAPRQHYRQRAGAGADPDLQSGFFHGDFADMGGFNDIFSSFMSRRGERPASSGRGGEGRSADMHFSMDVDFLDAVNGNTVSVSLSNGNQIDVKIPAGTRDGQTLRLRGKGAATAPGGEVGDAMIEVRVKPHAFYSRDGDDIRLDLPITVREAVLGGKVRVPTPGGPVQLSLKPNSSSGTVLRLKGKGVRKAGGQSGGSSADQAGDLYARLQIVLPSTPDAALAAFLESQPAPSDEEIRRHMLR